MPGTRLPHVAIEKDPDGVLEFRQIAPLVARVVQQGAGLPCHLALPGEEPGLILQITGNIYFRLGRQGWQQQGKPQQIVLGHGKTPLDVSFDRSIWT